MAIEFKDTTSYSRDEKDRTPRTWQAHIGKFSITVTRHINYDPDVWIAMTSPDILDKKVLKSKDIEDAKKEAIDLFREGCQKIIEALV